jgi:ATP-binding cassette subfamily F protein 3
MVTQPVGTLSGGEKARLVLAMLVWQRPNLLLLDEPTNHLDLTTREALSMALNEFEGTVLLVSHDRALLREVCDEFWLVTAGAVQPFDGDLDDYQRWLLEQSRSAAKERAGGEKAKRQRAADAAATPTPSSKAAKGSGAAAGSERSAAPGASNKTKPSKHAPPTTSRPATAEGVKPLRKELNLVDNRLGVLFAERETLEAAYATADPDPATLAENGRRLKQIVEQIDVLEARWLELSTRIDQLAAAG